VSTPKYHNFFLDNGILSHNCAFVGQTGVGKSWACLKVAEEYSKMFNIPFNPEHHVISSLREMLMLITDTEVNKKIQFGTPIVFDEPQVEGNARNWQSDMNKAFSQLISTFRNQRLVVLFAVPFLDMIDKQSRILFHGEFKVLGFDKNTGVTKIKPRFLEYNKNIDDFYRKRLIIEYAMPGKSVHNIRKLNFWHLEKASELTTTIYERKKKEFTDALNKKLLNQIELQERIAQSKDKAHDLFKVKDLMEKYGGDILEISKEMPNLSPVMIEKYVLMIRRSKGESYVRYNPGLIRKKV
jgi:hypothetical protein